MPEQDTVVKQRIIIPIAEAIHECQREQSVRQRCYSRWVTEGKLTQFEATERLIRMAAAIQWLARLQAEAESAAANVLDTSDYTPA
jgi:hypothetical protein